MSGDRFNGHRIITTGSGQCQDCRQCITRVLVGYPAGRRWETADTGAHEYIKHTCPSPSNLRKAA